MIVHEIIDYQAKHLFPVLRKQAEAAIEDEFATSLLPKIKPTRSELNEAVVKAVEETIREKQAGSAIRKATGHTLESE